MPVFSFAELIGYAAAIVAGLVIGLAGGGGSILTVPIFVYLFQIEPVLATTYSLFVVGTTSFVGSVGYGLKKRIDFKVTAAFAVPSFISVYLTRRWLVPAIPDPFLRLGTYELSKSTAILYFFAFVMIMAAQAMIRHRQPRRADRVFKRPRLGLLALDGLAVGMLTGTIGAGGGFLIVPMLVLLAGLPMRMAVGTSVLIIAVNSFVGFMGDLHRPDLDWPFLVRFTFFSIVGIFVGMYLSRLVPAVQLKKGFGWFVLVVAFYIIGSELVKLY
ncbi:sulfite exporter TauE/SafE family protein [Nibrella saemangeumensis]|uniref:Probable membrane transporter protein n=1 Tax=Nibrella saemangeumensis TaxID=1084526 RepID=A0ABP8MW34_9BACT